VPRDADATLIEAHFDAGLLSITVPMTRAATNRSLKIDVS
jgi:HSP20 family molecular chaperone IbpA